MNLIEQLKSQPFFDEIALSPSLIVYGPDSVVESIILVQIIAIAEDLLDGTGSDYDLFDQIFSQTKNITLADLQALINT